MKNIIPKNVSFVAIGDLSKDEFKERGNVQGAEFEALLNKLLRIMQASIKNYIEYFFLKLKQTLSNNSNFNFIF